jgi:hypothetical protein
MCTGFMSFAQPIRVTFDEFPQRAFKNPSFTSSSNLRTEATILTLPFWEDFSDTANLGNHFKPNTGIYFNNHLCLNQPSVNVATFDGLDGNGKKYDPNYVFQMDKADSLVSLDFDISALSAKDSLYFSFQYQMAGYGEVPDQLEGDSLVLQFFTKAGKWKSVWHSDFKIATDTSLFYPVLFKVTDSVFFHSNFKFKFFNYARLSGMFDLWHVDYIVMDTINAPNNNRGLKNGRLYFSDNAISKSPTSLLTPYQAIPVNHITNIPFRSNFDFSISSLSSDTFKAVKTFYSLEKISNSGNIQEPNSASAIIDINPGSILLIKQPISTSLTPYSQDFILKTKVFVNELQATTDNYQFQKNDTVVSIFPFKNYYAYDDGEYEYGVRFDQVNALQAVKYETYQSDTITHIDMCIPPIGYNIQGSGFLMKIWADDNGKPGKELYSHREIARYYVDTTAAPYSNGLNPFTRYAIVDKTIIIPKGVFYIGFKQLSGNSKAIRLGFDSNNDNKDKFWYDNNQGNGWSQFRNLNGSMMIRPVFANGAKDYTNKRIGDGQFKLEMYPNPNNTDLLTLNDTFDNVRIYDPTGRLRLNYDSVEKIDISSLEAGFFFVKAIINGSVHTLQLSRVQK